MFRYLLIVVVLIAAICLTPAAVDIAVDAAADEETDTHAFNFSTTDTPAVGCYQSDRDAGFHCALREPVDGFTSAAIKRGRFGIVLGIGSSHSGSLELQRLLSQHSNISIASAVAGGRDCCEAQTFFFLRTRELDRGIDRYAQFFPTAAISKIHSISSSSLSSGASSSSDEKTSFWGFENTPRYSTDTSAPYRARAFLPAADTKLIFTIRDVLDRDMSEYLAYVATTTAATAGSSIPPKPRSSISYEEYLDQRIQSFQRWVQCREQAFQLMRIPDSVGSKQWASLRDLLDVTMIGPDTVAVIEHELNKKCTAIAVTTNAATGKAPLLLPPLQGNLYAQNIRRWANAFKADNLLCFHSEDIAADPLRVQRSLSTFLQLENDGWSGYKPSPLDNAVTTVTDTFTSATIGDAAATAANIPTTVAAAGSAMDYFKQHLSADEAIEVATAMRGKLEAALNRVAPVSEAEKEWLSLLCPRFN